MNPKFFVLGLLVLLSLANVGFAVTLSSCGTLSTANTTYTLNQSISAAGTCITIGANNITLDGAGYTITAGGSGYGISISSFHNNSIKNSIVLALGLNGRAISLSGSNSNNISNSTFTGGEYGNAVFIETSNFNVFSGGSILSQNNGLDYQFSVIGNANRFSNTNFTTRKFFFGSAADQFNYNNQTNGNLWLNTNTSYAFGLTVTRTLINWSNTSLIWNDTASSTTTATYALTGLLASKNYTVRNGSTSRLFATDSSGNLSVNIGLAGGVVTALQINTTAGGGDTLPPSIAIQSPTNKTYGTTTFDLNFTVSDDTGVSSCLYELDGINRTISNCLNISIATKMRPATQTAGTNNMTDLSFGDTITKMTLNTADYFFNFSFQINTVTSTMSAGFGGLLDMACDYYAIPWNYTSNNWARGSSWTYSNPAFWNGNQTKLKLSRNLQGVSCSNSYEYFNISDFYASLLNSNDSHSIKVWANDTSNNWGFSNTVSFAIDTTGPTISVQSPTGTYATTNISLNFIVGDSSGVSSCKYELNGAANVSLPSCANTTFIGINGANTLKVYANDTLNNLGVGTVSFTVDTTLPIITIQSPANRNYASSAIDLNFTASSPSGISTCVYELDSVNTTITGCQNTTLQTKNWVYQEDANNTVCFGTWSGFNPCSRTYDGDWDTSGAGEAYSIGYANFTFVKPSGASGFKLQARTHLTATANYTLPSSCTANQNITILITSDTNQLSNRIDCYNSSNGLVGILTDTGGSFFYELGLWIGSDSNLSGSHSVRIYANNSANIWSVSNSVSFGVDTMNPSVSCVSCPVSSTNPTIAFSITATDNLAGVDSARLFYRGNYYTMAPSGSTYSYTLTENNNGEQTYRFFVNDSAGNVNSSLSGSVYVGAITSSPPVYVPPPAPPAASGGGGSGSSPSNLNELSPEELARLGELVENISRVRRNITARNQVVYIERPSADQINITGITSLVDRAKFDPKRLNEPYIFPNASEFDSLRSAKISKIEVLTVSSVATAAVVFWVLGPGILFVSSSLILTYFEAFYLANLPLVNDTIKTATVGG